MSETINSVLPETFEGLPTVGETKLFFEEEKGYNYLRDLHRFLQSVHPEQTPKAAILPYGAELGKFMQWDRLLWEVGIYAHTINQHAYPKKDTLNHPLVVSRFTGNGFNTVGVLLSENGAESYDYFEGQRPFYRATNAAQLQSVLKHGFFQVPGRSAFFEKWSPQMGWLGSGRLLTVVNLSHDQVAKGNSSPGTAALAFPKDGKFASVRLPEDIRRNLSGIPPFVSDGQSNYDSEEYRRVLEAQVLLGGDLAGVLCHVPSSQIDIEATLHINTQLAQQNRVRSEDVDALLKLVKS